jgi:hypothetical protein
MAKDSFDKRDYASHTGAYWPQRYQYSAWPKALVR